MYWVRLGLRLAAFLALSGVAAVAISSRWGLAGLLDPHEIERQARSYLRESESSNPLPVQGAPLIVGNAAPFPIGSPSDAPIPATSAAAPRSITVVIDPGHGGGDRGAVHVTANGRIDLAERDTSLDIATRLKRYLERSGYRVILTHQGGQDHNSPPLDAAARVSVAHDAGADLFLGIHHNSSPDHQQSGLEVWYCENSIAVHQSATVASLTLENVLHALATRGYAATNRGVKADASNKPGFGCTRYGNGWPAAPSVLAELLFVTNDADAAQLIRPEGRDAIARGLAQAVHSYFQPD